MSTKKIAVSCLNKQDTPKAQTLATKLNLPYCEHPTKDFEFLLIYQNDRLTLADTSAKLGNPIYVDFLTGKDGYRLSHLQHELILKAVGCKKNFKPQIIDATAGLGTDGFILAANGCEVLMLEQSPILTALVEDGLKRFFAENSAAIKLNLLCIDAKDYLQQQPDHICDVVYLDPMFPTRKKSALVKKEMRILQQLLPPPTDELNQALFSIALSKAKKRIVVKRPLDAPLITTQTPDFQYKGKSIRFDVYVVKC